MLRRRGLRPGHFSPWAYNIDEAARALLDGEGWPAPDPQGLPTGAEIVRDYLKPLAAHPALAPHLVLDAEVVAITRRGLDKLGSTGRDAAPFVVRWKDAQGHLHTRLARAVLDASGTWLTPNPIGIDGLPVPGEAENQARIAYGIPDVLGRSRGLHVGRRTLVIGSGHSAIGRGDSGRPCRGARRAPGAAGDRCLQYACAGERGIRLLRRTGTGRNRRLLRRRCRGKGRGFEGVRLRTFARTRSPARTRCVTVSDALAPAEAPAGRGRVITGLGTTQILAWGSTYYLLAVLAEPIVVTPAGVAVLSSAVSRSDFLSPASSQSGLGKPSSGSAAGPSSPRARS
jgi:hypothetical protein